MEAQIETPQSQPEAVIPAKKVRKPRTPKTAKKEASTSMGEVLSKAKAVKEVASMTSLTGGGARPALFTNTLGKDIVARYPSVAKMMEKLHQDSGIRTAAFFVSYRPDPQKSARMSDWFKLSWSKGGKKEGDLPKTMATSQQLNIAALVKVDAALAFVQKLNEPIVYLTLEKGSKKISINGSFKK
jgi:hypothetical protein